VATALKHRKATPQAAANAATKAAAKAAAKAASRKRSSWLLTVAAAIDDYIVAEDKPNQQQPNLFFLTFSMLLSTVVSADSAGIVTGNGVDTIVPLVRANSSAVTVTGACTMTCFTLAAACAPGAEYVIEGWLIMGIDVGCGAP